MNKYLGEVVWCVCICISGREAVQLLFLIHISLTWDWLPGQSRSIPVPGSPHSLTCTDPNTKERD